VRLKIARTQAGFLTKQFERATPKFRSIMLSEGAIGPSGFFEQAMRSPLTLDPPAVAQERREHESRFGGWPSLFHWTNSLTSDLGLFNGKGAGFAVPGKQPRTTEENSDFKRDQSVVSIQFQQDHVEMFGLWSTDFAIQSTGLNQSVPYR
jgi:hypothetical protein